MPTAPQHQPEPELEKLTVQAPLLRQQLLDW